jgi:hypothetical protein
MQMIGIGLHPSAHDARRGPRLKGPTFGPVLTAAKLVALFTLLTAIATWPQAADRDRRQNTRTCFQHVAVRVGRARIGHVPGPVVRRNIFHPEPRTLTFSDAMPLEAFLAAPFLWAGTPPVLVHNLMLLAGIVLSAVGIAVLVRSLTGSLAAGVTAGVVFAFAPYRFEHYMHMELQWTVWIPWTFWALHRTLETGARKFGALTGVFLAPCSCRYLLRCLPRDAHGLVAVLLLCELRRLRRRTRWLSIAWLRRIPRRAVCDGLATKQQMGARSAEQVLTFASRPATPSPPTELPVVSARRRAAVRSGVCWGFCRAAGRCRLLLRPPSAQVIAFAGAAAAFEMSLGGHSYIFSIGTS